MGYQNGDRPDDNEILLYDISFDLTDLKDDIIRGEPKEKLLEAIDFIKESLRILLPKE